MEHKHSPAPSVDGLSLGSSPAVSRSPSPEVGRRAQSPSPELTAAAATTSFGRRAASAATSFARRQRSEECRTGAPPNSSEGGGRDEEMGV